VVRMLGDALAAALPGLRAQAESRMYDTCRIADLGVPETAPDGSVEVVGEVVYSGKCEVSTYEPYERTPEAGGATSTVQRYKVKVPVGSLAPEVGQVVEITASRFDPNLVGRQYRVKGLLHKSAATAYRLLVDEYVGETVVWTAGS